MKVWDEGLSGGYATDDIAETVKSLVPNSGIQEVYDYIAAVHRFSDVGSTCGVIAYDFVQWLRKERPHVYAALLCEQESVVVIHDETTGYAFSDSTMVHAGLVLTGGFGTKEDALLAAAERLIELGEELGSEHLC